MHLPRRRPRLEQAVKVLGILPEPMREPVTVSAMFVSVWSLAFGYAASQAAHGVANTIRHLQGHTKLSRFDVLHTKKYLHQLKEHIH